MYEACDACGCLGCRHCEPCGHQEKVAPVTSPQPLRLSLEEECIRDVRVVPTTSEGFHSLPVCEACAWSYNCVARLYRVLPLCGAAITCSRSPAAPVIAQRHTDTLPASPQSVYGGRSGC